MSSPQIRPRGLRAAISLALGVTACATARAAPVHPPPASRPLDAATEARLDSVVRATMRARDVPGAAVAVLRRDSVVFMRGFGVADLQRRTPVTERTVFQLASTTKPFTAMLVLILADEGRLELDAPAARYLPWLPARYASVTVRQLLNHTAGVPADMRRANVDEFPIDEFRRRFSAAEAPSTPGTRWAYANAGYTLLSLIVEAVERRPFGESLNARIFRPLGMAQSGYRV
ncbi:MAG TPA: serine hydrolase domain-containing protein, partial [Longimicrobium sp.]